MVVVVVLCAGLIAVANMTTLQTINLSGCVSVTDVGVLMLTQLPALTSMDLSWCIKLSDAGGLHAASHPHG